MLDERSGPGVKKSLFVVIGLAMLVFFGLIVSPTLASMFGMPEEIRLFQGTEYSLDLRLPLKMVDGQGSDVTGSEGGISFSTEQVGKQHFQVRLFGVIPIKDMVVDVVPEVQLYPGGHSIGVLVNTVGVKISRIVPVRGIDGKEYFPAVDAGLQVGDIILAIGDRVITKPEEIRQTINELITDRESLSITVKRNEQTIRTNITPVLSAQEDAFGNEQHSYLLGLYLEDPAAGVGTLTFYDALSGRYGALGHVIQDGLGRDVAISTGNIVQASISSIKQGIRGLPGEKLGIFDYGQAAIGTIDKNTKFGIFGDLSKPVEQPYFSKPIPIASLHEVKVGPAKIYTVLNGNQIEEFAVQITKVNPQNSPSDKGMVITVTDPELLAKTGGIVQGMSGSPIVQNNKLVGAITHVFINNPNMGYGSFIEWMINEAGLTNRNSIETTALQAS